MSIRHKSYLQSWKTDRHIYGINTRNTVCEITAHLLTQIKKQLQQNALTAKSNAISQAKSLHCEIITCDHDQLAGKITYIILKEKCTCC